MHPNMEKTYVLVDLRSWVSKRPKLNPADYVSTDPAWRQGYKRDARRIAQQLRDAKAMLSYIDNEPTISADDIVQASRCAHGVTIQKKLSDGVFKGYFELDYVQGQYWPTEYRRAACLTLSEAIWENVRNTEPGITKPEIKKKIGAKLGRGLVNRWFN